MPVRDCGDCGDCGQNRFKSQALLDEPALMACMAYVGLNRIHATMAETPEESDVTLIQQRIRSVLHGEQNYPGLSGKVKKIPAQPVQLYLFAGNVREPMPEILIRLRAASRCKKPRL